MGEVAKYKVVAGVDPEKVAEKVEQLLKEHYQPLSGISVTMSSGKAFFAQAMVKYRPTPGNGR